MYKKKGELLLGLILFLLLFIVPFLSFGNQQPQKAGSSSSVKSSHKSTKSAGRAFHILNTATGQVFTVDDRDFLYGAVAAEMSPEAEPEALKAQAVACYTYYSRQRTLNKKSPSSSLKGADFSADTKNGIIYCPKELMKSHWGSKFDERYQKLTTAVESVFGQVLKSDGELIDATYYAISSGNTENSKDIWGGNCPYLISVASPGDIFAGGFQTKVIVGADKFKSGILNISPKANLSGDPSTWIGVSERTAAGSVKNMVLGNQTLTGNQIRSAFNLRSANFTISYSDNSFTFFVKGYGHGVGMSQAGAQYMAKQGADYKQILSWYYPTSVLGNL